MQLIGSSPPNEASDYVGNLPPKKERKAQAGWSKHIRLDSERATLREEVDVIGV